MRSTSSARVAARYIAAKFKFDPYAPQSVEDVLHTHLYTTSVTNDDDLNLDVSGEPSGMAALMNRARKWSLAEFIAYMEQYAWVYRIDELRKSLATEHLEYRVMVNGKVKSKGVTSEANLPRLREHLADYYKYEKWADKMEIVTRPRPKADYAKLDALLKAQAERERAWADLYADLRVPKPELVDGQLTSDTMMVWVQDRGVRVGGIHLSKEDHTSDLTFVGCEEDIRKLVAQYGDGPVWTVPKSTLWPEYRGKGTGVAVYLRAIERLRAKGPKPVYLEAHQCLRSKSGVFGLTSEDALRVWKKLTTRFPSSGTVIAIV
jgi:GNAT superfamily N-acetyltransferase